ncbi:flavin-containing monooxygenase 5-like [Dreissena polymorpha]|uniref:Flavin-containing monooxygenase n=1 Tax=Dreissena polymorpha TaxID=45954 RepID=A0A9D4HX48_DREPO|nr:flavin-containing monooxygenase 5-like [Dreissena polymorpha]KAH3735983.1 hypothetical protein DPMN_042544 [Dreissena polymorpha]
MPARRIAVIGAGSSGLTALKCCLDEGLEPVCFERTGYIGGLWHFTNESTEGQACVMRSTVINTSKEMMCYSDFPIPAEFAIYMHNTKVDRYLNMYAEKFGLRKYIRFHIEVVHVKIGSEPGKWEVTTRTKNADDVTTEIYDGVLVCTGHHADKNIPAFPSIDKFRGRVVHTHDYKDFRGYEDKRVLIIGIGNSGGDVATELSRISSQVYLSTRSGSWIFNRVDKGGDPVDMRNSTRFMKTLRRRLPSSWANKLLEMRLNGRFDHAKYSLRPSYPPFAAHPTINDELPNRIASGGVIVKPNVKEFTENGVIFEDDSVEDDIDEVVLATGYIFGFPFLDKSITEVKDNKVNLYKYMFPPDLQHPTLAIIGCFQPLGAIMPLSEMQCRLATRVFTGDVQLPSRQHMFDDIRRKQEEMAGRYNASLRHTIQVEYIPFMDELAELIGCKPDIKKLLLSDPMLALKCYFGPATPYQYRLRGPGPWAGAREHIFTQWERTYLPLRTRPVKGGNLTETSGNTYLLLFVIVLIMAYLLYMLCD